MSGERARRSLPFCVNIGLCLVSWLRRRKVRWVDDSQKRFDCTQRSTQRKAMWGELHAWGDRGRWMGSGLEARGWELGVLEVLGERWCWRMLAG